MSKDTCITGLPLASGSGEEFGFEAGDALAGEAVAVAGAGQALLQTAVVLGPERGLQ
ncbi:MAG: hypothetical protein ACRDOE_06200 [Streptosporangiaceae bacterium]